MGFEVLSEQVTQRVILFLEDKVGGVGHAYGELLDLHFELSRVTNVHPPE